MVCILLSSGQLCLENIMAAGHRLPAIRPDHGLRRGRSSLVQTGATEPVHRRTVSASCGQSRRSGCLPSSARALSTWRWRTGRLTWCGFWYLTPATTSCSRSRSFHTEEDWISCLNKEGHLKEQSLECKVYARGYREGLHTDFPRHDLHKDVHKIVLKHLLELFPEIFIQSWEGVIFSA